MKKIKKFLSVILAMLMISLLFSVSSFAVWPFEAYNSTTYNTGTYYYYARFNPLNKTGEAETIMWCDYGNTVSASNQCIIEYKDYSYEYNITNECTQSVMCNCICDMVATTNDLSTIAAVSSEHNIFYNGVYIRTVGVSVIINGYN